MTVVHNPRTSGRLNYASERFDAVLLSNRVVAGATVIAATGEIDASNVARFTLYAEDQIGQGRPIVIDLTALGFLGAQGIPALLRIHKRCAEAGLRWAVVPSHSVRRLLRICDKDSQLPAAATVAEALESISGRRRERGLLQLVTETG